jgi:hypothetical protein
MNLEWRKIRSIYRQRRLAERYKSWPSGGSPHTARKPKAASSAVFSTAQDRLVKGLRGAGVSSLEQANTYWEKEFLPWWNRTLTVEPGNACDAHRPLFEEHALPAILSHVDQRQVSNGYTVQYCGQTYQIPRNQVRTGMRGAQVRVEVRLDGTIGMRFRDEYLAVQLCTAAVAPPKDKPTTKARRTSPRKSRWMQGFFDMPALPLGKAIAIANATS